MRIAIPLVTNGLYVGDRVKVRSLVEILSTLDSDGCLDALPFMPEMTKYCGKEFRVYKKLLKACNTIDKSMEMRPVANTVLLEGIRCDGSAHGGCESACLIMWKEAWLKPLSVEREDARSNESSFKEADLIRATQSKDELEGDRAVTYRCQITEMNKASLPRAISRWKLNQYVLEVWYGNRHIWECVRMLLVQLFNTVQAWRGGNQYPYLEEGVLTKTPNVELDLQPGEMVEVKSSEEIVQTLSTTMKNRGLWFDKEQVQFCGRRFEVQGVVKRLIDERSGKLTILPNKCIILKDVICEGRVHQYCPRSPYIFWREAWLRRVRG